MPLSVLHINQHQELGANDPLWQRSARQLSLKSATMEGRRANNLARLVLHPLDSSDPIGVNLCVELLSEEAMLSVGRTEQPEELEAGISTMNRVHKARFDGRSRLSFEHLEPDRVTIVEMRQHWLSLKAFGSRDLQAGYSSRLIAYFMLIPIPSFLCILKFYQICQVCTYAWLDDPSEMTACCIQHD